MLCLQEVLEEHYEEAFRPFMESRELLLLLFMIFKLFEGSNRVVFPNNYLFSRLRGRVHEEDDRPARRRVRDVREEAGL